MHERDVLHLADFPENQLGASLKRDGPLPAREGAQDFPENQLGASLKRRTEDAAEPT